jgi:hypothetical protein
MAADKRVSKTRKDRRLAVKRARRTPAAILTRHDKCQIEHEQPFAAVGDKHRRPTLALGERRKTRVRSRCGIEPQAHHSGPAVSLGQLMDGQQDRRRNIVRRAFGRRKARVERLQTVEECQRRRLQLPV